MFINLPQVSQQNVVAILKKLNDESYVRVIRSCRWLYEISGLMEAKTRIFCHGYLAIFVYFDMEERKPCYDVLLDVNKKRDKKAALSRLVVNAPRLIHQLDNESDSETSDASVDSNLHLQDSDETASSNESYGSHQPENCPNFEECEQELCELLRDEEQYILNDPLDLLWSHLTFGFSKRQNAFHTKMEREEVMKLLRHWKFNTVTIDAVEPHEVKISEDILITTTQELIQLVPIIRAKSLKLDSTYSENHFYDILKIATTNFGLNCLQIQNHKICGRIETLKTDWNMLKEVVALTDEKTVLGTMRNFLMKWTNGGTNIHRLQLDTESDQNVSPETIGFSNFMMLQKHFNMTERLYFRQDKVNGQNRLALFLPIYQLAIFRDVTDCDSCDCQMDFCFKKVVETILEYKNEDGMDFAIDFGPILNRWDGRDVAKLGQILEEILV